MENISQDRATLTHQVPQPIKDGTGAIDLGPRNVLLDQLIVSLIFKIIQCDVLAQSHVILSSRIVSRKERQMYLPPWLSQKPYLNVYQCSACLVKKGLMRVMRQKSNEANIFRDAPDGTPPNLICFEKVGPGSYRSEHCFLHSNITTLWLTQNLSHRASSN